MKIPSFHFASNWFPLRGLNVLERDDDSKKVLQTSTKAIIILFAFFFCANSTQGKEENELS